MPTGTPTGMPNDRSLPSGMPWVAYVLTRRQMRSVFDMPSVKGEVNILVSCITVQRTPRARQSCGPS